VDPGAAQFRDRRVARTVVLPAAVVLLLGVVALASRQPLHPPRATPLSTLPAGHSGAVSPWPIVLVGLAAAVILASFALNLFWSRGSQGFERPRGSMLRQTALVTLVLLGGALVVSAVRGHRGTPLRGGLAHGALAGRARAASPTFQFPLWAQLTVALLALAAAVLVATSLGRRWRATDAPQPPTLGPEITAAIDRSLDDLEADPDARRAIIAAYRRMEESLAHVGLPRGPSETAREYLSRGLASLELSPGAIGTLTTLFERAKFSLRHVDLRLRDEAISALRALQEELA
jgi:hypothetical protein